MAMGDPEYYNVLAMASCRELRQTVIDVCMALGGTVDFCNRLADEAEDAGIDCILDFGDIRLGYTRLLGKGWAGFVLAAKADEHYVALKALNPKGRRHTMLGEAVAAYAASLVGVMKKILYVGTHILVYEIIVGPDLGSYLPRSPEEASHVAMKLLVKAYMLDRIGLRHNELARPEKQVIIDVQEHLEPYIIDYESATWGEASNLSQLLGGLHRTPLGKLCSLHELVSTLKPLLRCYKSSGSIEARRAILSEILARVRDACSRETELGRASSQPAGRQQWSNKTA